MFLTSQHPMLSKYLCLKVNMKLKRTPITFKTCSWSYCEQFIGAHYFKKIKLINE